nr:MULTISPECIES: hypothetical protein [Sinorhizobium]
MGSPIVNVNGGAIAIGHPIGASGARFPQHVALRDEAAGRFPGLASAAAWASPCASSAFSSSALLPQRRAHSGAAMHIARCCASEHIIGIAVRRARRFVRRQRFGGSPINSRQCPPSDIQSSHKIKLDATVA